MHRHGSNVAVIAAIRRTKCYGTCRRDRPGQSALMPTNFTTLPHFSVSSAMSLGRRTLWIAAKGFRSSILLFWT